MVQAECRGERLSITARESRLDRRMRRVSWRRLRKCAAPVGAPSLCIAAILAIGGCAPSRADWTRPGMTGAEFRRDLADCERQATGPGPFRFKALSEDYETARDRIARERDRCMEERGWQPSSTNGAARWRSVRERYCYGAHGWRSTRLRGG